MLVWTAACFNPYLRDDTAAADDQQAFDQLDYAVHKRTPLAADDESERMNVVRHTRRTSRHSSRAAGAGDADAAPSAAGDTSTTVDDRRQLSDFAHLSDDDIQRALSRLSTTELRSLDYFMDEEIGHAMDKRETSRRDADEALDREEAREWRKTVSDGDGYDDYGEMDDNEDGGQGGASGAQKHEEDDHAMSKRMAMGQLGERVERAGGGGQRREIFRRSSSFNQAADKHVQAHINLLREKQKRQMAGKCKADRLHACVQIRQNR